MNQLRFIRDTLYDLKRRYGEVVDFIRIVSSTVDRETGDKIVVKSGLRVNRCIVLNSYELRKFVYDLSFIATNKNFTYGGFFDQTQRDFIVDAVDINYEPLQGQYLVYDGTRFDIHQVQRFEGRTGYLIRGKQTKGIDIDNVINLSLHTQLNFTDEADYGI